MQPFCPLYLKRHIVVDKNGFLLAVIATVANIHDGKAADFLMRTLAYLFIPLKIILADGSYRERLSNK
ncbi:transposase [Capnocytophaga canimorsus]|uniref:transposase n=1 Tax=Capnocytophaga canimorsus TaxID=28188 RepID=UPI000F71A25E|nr:transposase [Capnocytophaga canimorsus]VEJ19985.1 Uncharacterised protein [Capnocytophaga canimorsus]